jgi:hypothetical protein
MRAYVVVLLAGLSLSLTACIGGRSPDARFFQLQPSMELAPMKGGVDPAVFIVVKPVSLEAYLRQPQMADRVGPHEVKYDEFSRWAEPLDRNITRVVTENLRRLLKTDRIAVLPQGLAGEKIVTLFAEVKRFERQPDGTAILSAGWLVQCEPEELAPKLGTADLTAYILGQTADDVAAAQSKLLADLSARMAADIAAMPCLKH